MKLDTKLLGTPLKHYQTKIGWRETTNYAASVEDNNPWYFDDREAAGIVSHPMFPVSVTWPVLSRLDTFIESNDFPKEVLMTQVHYTEHLILHRLVRPGDELSVIGTLKAFLPHRAGTHAIICLEAQDKKGELVFTEYAGAMLRGVGCGEGGQVGPLSSDSREYQQDRSALDIEYPYRSATSLYLRWMQQHCISDPHITEFCPDGGSARKHFAGDRNPGIWGP